VPPARARRVAPRQPQRGRHRWQADEIDELGIELRPAALLERPQARVEAARRAVAAGDRDRVDRVGDRHDPRGEWNRRAADASGIATTVPALVMREHAALELGIEGGERREHGGATARMGRDRLALGRRQARPIMDQVKERLVDLADVMEERDPLDHVALARRQVGGIGDDERVAGNAPHVRPGLRVGRIDRIEERFEHRRRQSLGATPIPRVPSRLPRLVRQSHPVPSSSRPPSSFRHDFGGGNRLRARCRPVGVGPPVDLPERCHRAADRGAGRGAGP